MTLFYLLFCWAGTPHAGEAFQDQLAAGRFRDRAHSTLTYDFEWHSLPPTIRIYPPLGCALLFDRPFVDTWASDVQGHGTGKFYQYTPWGRTEGGADKLIVAAMVPTKEPVNLFFLFGDRVLEVLLVQVATQAEADRMVTIRFKGATDSEPEPSTSIPNAGSAPKNRPEGLVWEALNRKHRKKKIPHGRVTYNLDRDPFFVAFRPHPQSPPLVALEVVRATPKRFGKGFRFEYPFPELDRTLEGNTHVLRFPNIALERRERLYLRIQVEGERKARFYKLKKRRS